jgi:hypothetical protein
LTAKTAANTKAIADAATAKTADANAKKAVTTATAA